jgi:hypothetical protein
VIERVLAEVADEDVIVTVIIEISDAHALSPTSAHKPRLLGDISKRPIAVVPVEMIGWGLTLRQVIQPSAIDEEDVLPAVIVKVDERNSASRRLEKVSILVLVSVNGLVFDSGLLRYIDELDSHFAVRRLQRRASNRNKSDAHHRHDHTCSILSRASHQCPPS